MNPEIKQQWLQALRSGEYQQARGNLRVDNTFCCLGVLCDLAIKQNVVPAWQKERETDYQWYIHEPREWAGSDNRQAAVLPKAVVAWAGLPDANPELIPTEKLADRKFLANYNDGRQAFGNLAPHTFTQLADLIEKYL